MAKQTINIGTAPNDGTGTPLRTAFDYCNLNFTELYTAVGPSGNNIVVPGTATITGDLTVDTSTLKVDSANDRVGILTTTPAYALDVNGDAKVTNALRYFVGATQYGLSFANAGALGVESYQGTYIFLGTGAGASATERFRIANDGVCTWSNVGGVAGTAMTLNATGLGVGMTPASSQSRVQIYQALGTTINGALHITDNATTGLLFNNTSSGVSSIWTSGILTFSTGSNAYSTNGARMTLDASGNLLVGTTTNGGNGVSIRPSTSAPNAVLVGSDTSGGTAWQMYSTGTSSSRFYVTWAGTINAVNTTIAAISDARLKENVQDIDVGLGAILALKPRKFDWKAGKGKDIKGDRGFIAQEFEQVFPQLVDEWADPAPEGEAPYKSVRQDLIPVLVKAIQELAAEVNALKNA
jgi:hypothetical protein